MPTNNHKVIQSNLLKYFSVKEKEVTDMMIPLQ